MLALVFIIRCGGIVNAAKSGCCLIANFIAIVFCHCSKVVNRLDIKKSLYWKIGTGFCIFDFDMLVGLL